MFRIIFNSTPCFHMLARKSRSYKREPKKRSTCDISALIDEVLARDTDKTDNDDSPGGPCKRRKTTSGGDSSTPCSLTQMIEMTAKENGKSADAKSLPSSIAS